MATKDSGGGFSDLLGLPSLSDIAGTSAAESSGTSSGSIGDFIVGGGKAQLSPVAWIAIAAAAVALIIFLAR